VKGSCNRGRLIKKNQQPIKIKKIIIIWQFGRPLYSEVTNTVQRSWWKDIGIFQRIKTTFDQGFYYLTRLRICLKQTVHHILYGARWTEENITGVSFCLVILIPCQSSIRYICWYLPNDIYHCVTWSSRFKNVYCPLK
jgi:hypothetical protein